MAIKTNILVDQGTDYEVTINVTDESSAPINLAGYTGKAQFRKHYSSLKSYDFTVTVNEVTGEVTLALNSDTTSCVNAGRYVYDCELISASGIKSRIAEGILTIVPRVTR